MDNKLLKKLNLKHPVHACVLDAPASFSPHLNDLQAIVKVDTQAVASAKYDFVLCFAQNAKQLEAHFTQVKAQLEDDVVLWMAYPKKSSKNYTSDIHRDSDVWQILGDADYEGVRQVAIDEDWSALRFRDVRYIKKMVRDPKRSMSKAGKKRTT